MGVGEIGVIREGVIIESVVGLFGGSGRFLAATSAHADKLIDDSKPAMANPFTMGVNFIGILLP